MSLIQENGSQKEKRFSGLVSSNPFHNMDNDLHVQMKREKTLAHSMFPEGPIIKNETVDYSYRVLILTHLPTGDNYGIKTTYAYTFATMLHASWKYVVSQNEWAKNQIEGMKVDLVVYFDEKFDSGKIPNDCAEISSPKSIDLRQPSRCYRRVVSATNHAYNYMNGFAYLQDSELPEILSKYHYVLRSDADCFITPSFLKFKLKPAVEIAFNGWCYHGEFAGKMLKKLAKELDWKRQSTFESAGSAWYMKSDKFIGLSQKTLFATQYVFENGWNITKYPEIEPYIKTNSKGSWPEWWQPISLLYGGDLAIHDFFYNLTTAKNQMSIIDHDTHGSEHLLTSAIHLHAIHGSDKVTFDKFAFMRRVETFCSNGNMTESMKAMLTNELNVHPNAVTKDMKINDYASMVSVRGAIDYVMQNGCYLNLDRPW